MGENIQIVHDYLLSTIRGHAKIVDKMNRLTGSREERLDRYIAELKKLSFVHGVTVHTTEKNGNREFDALLDVRTAAGQYRLAAEISSSYPTQVILNSIVASARRFETQNRKKNMFYVVLLGRTAHVPEEKLLEKGINFIDLAGNMNLKLSENYQAVIVGRREKRLEESEFSRVSSRAGVQLLFTLAAHPDAANWPIRQLAEVSGISKSIVARLKHRLVRAEMLQPAGHQFRLRSPNEIREQLLSGYGETLYPRILQGRFRSATRDSKELLSKVSGVLAETHTRWALTGGPAADLLQHYYRGPEVPIFVDKPRADLPGRLRLLPDRNGPIKLLSAFGPLAFWRTIDSYTIAHPWLIFAELMQSEDSRAHEAAEELYREFLTKHDRTLAGAN